MEQEKVDWMEERLMERAERRFLEAGPSRVRMDDLAHDLGISKKTIYAMVPGKEELLELVIERFVQTMRTRVDSILEDPDMAFVERSTKLFLEVSKRLSLIGRNTFTDMERYYPKAHRKVRQLRRKNLPEMISALVVQGQKEGLIKKNVDLDFFCEAYLQAVQGLMQRDSQEHHGLPFSEIPLRLSKLFFEGIRHPDYTGALIGSFN